MRTFPKVSQATIGAGLSNKAVLKMWPLMVPPVSRDSSMGSVPSDPMRFMSDCLLDVSKGSLLNDAVQFDSDQFCEFHSNSKSVSRGRNYPLRNSCDIPCNK